MVGFFKDRNIGKFACHGGSDRLWLTISNELRYLAEALRTLEGKLQNIKEASMRKLNFIVIKIKCPCRKKKTQCHSTTTNIKKPKS